MARPNLKTQLNDQKYREALASNAKSSERMLAQYKAFKPVFEVCLNKVLDEYGLAEKLTLAKAKGTKLKILNYQCGEGLYLHLFSELLEKRGLLEGAELNGIDMDATLIATADEFRQLSKPPRPYLQFYQHDVALSLEEEFNLTPLRDREGQICFDFIFSQYALAYRPNARQVLERLYNKNLKSGGVLFLRDLVTTEGAEGWLLPHQAIQPLAEASMGLLASYNPGVVVARAKTEWLEDIGAVQIQSTKDITPLGGTSPRGRDMMHSLILVHLHLGSEFVKLGLMSQEQYDELTQFIYNTLTLKDVGQFVFVDTLALKPDK